MKLIAIIGARLLVGLAYGQQATGLPMGLEYMMTRSQVLSQLKALEAHRVDSKAADTFAYVVPAPDTNAKNGLFLQFDQNRLVSITSMKSEMDKQLYQTYMSKLLQQAQQWKSQGVKTVHEDKSNAFYLYRDDKSYISFSGSPLQGKPGRFSVDLEFTEKRFFEKKHPDRK